VIIFYGDPNRPMLHDHAEPYTNYRTDTLFFAHKTLRPIYAMHRSHTPLSVFPDVIINAIYDHFVSI